MARRVDDTDLRRRLDAVRAAFRSPDGLLLVGVIGHLIRRRDTRYLAALCLDEVEAIARDIAPIRVQWRRPDGGVERVNVLSARFTASQVAARAAASAHRLRAFAERDLSRGRQKPRGTVAVYAGEVQRIAKRLRDLDEFLRQRAAAPWDPLLEPYRSRDAEQVLIFFEEWNRFQKWGPPEIRPAGGFPPGLVVELKRLRSHVAIAREIVRHAAGRSETDTEDFRRLLRARTRGTKS